MLARSGGSRLRRTWPQRLLISFNVCCIALALVGAGLVSYAKQTVSQIPRITIAGPGVQPVDELKPGAPQNFLIVGVDSDEGLAADDPVRDGRDDGAQATSGLRSDTIMVVRIDPAEEKARILSFPRDLWVDIPGHDRNRINTAIQYGTDGGPSLLISTIKANFGIDINHYVQVDFAGFKNVIKQIGGVEVYLSNPVRDGFSGLNQPDAGCVTLDENQALAYARSRHLQYQEDGKWKTDGTSDIGRISRQQDFTRRVIKRAIEKGARNPATLRRMIESGVKSTIALDQLTTPEDLITLGRTFRDYDPDELVSYSLPVVDVTRGGAAVLDLAETGTEPILELFRGTPVDGAATDGPAVEVEPSEITLRVLNGTGKVNQGADTTDQFAAAGFKVRSPGNDTDMTFQQTEVRYRAAQEAEAVQVARHLAADPVMVADPKAPEITVITGQDLLVLATPRPVEAISTSTTSTTTTSTTTTSTTTTSATTGSTGTSTTTTTTGASAAGPGVPTTIPKGYLPDVEGAGASCG